MSHGAEADSSRLVAGIVGADLHSNLSVPALYEEVVRRREGVVAAEGPLVCTTGVHTGRSPNDKFIVREPSSEAQIAWGGPNRPMSPEAFDTLHRDLLDSLANTTLFVQDVAAGADPAYRIPVRVTTAYAWHSLFARNLLITFQGDLSTDSLG